MTTFKNQSVILPDVTDDTIIEDNNDNYEVFAKGVPGTDQPSKVHNNKITFGDGDHDTVQGGHVSQNTITFGDGNEDKVGTLHLTNNKIAFGDGNADAVVVRILGSTGNTITFGNGHHDKFVMDGNSINDVIRFGNGSDDQVAVPFNGASDDHFTLGNGANDSVRVSFAYHDEITLGDGSGDTVDVTDVSSSNTIVVGNGNNDEIRLNNAHDLVNNGFDTIITGTGSSDTVLVAAHTHADTFGFSLGTNGSSFTTVTGAQKGDHVISGDNLGNKVVAEPGTSPTMAFFFQFVALHSPSSGTTYIGHSTTDTFIVTDHQGQLGAVDIVGVFNHSTVANHTLTLA